MKKFISLSLASLLTFVLIMPVYATEQSNESTAVSDTLQYNVLPYVGIPIEPDEVILSEQTVLRNSSGNGRTKIFGDVNYDGDVKAADILYMMSNLAGSADIDTTFGDVNFDGSIDMLDLVTLQRHVAGWDGYEDLPYGKEVYVSPLDCMPDILYYEPLSATGGRNYGLLTDEQKSVYNQIVTAVEAMDTSVIYAPSLTMKELMLCYYSVRNDHPEYFWLSQQYGYTVSGTPGIRLYFSFSESTKEQMTEDIKTALQKIVDHIGDTDYSDYELELLLHDHIVENTAYDTAAASSGNPNYYPYAWNIYGSLVWGKCVCEGYAESLMLILRMFGIDSGIATGSSHMWNCVMLDGEYYYVDPTWDDTGDKAEHYYFNLTYERMNEIHSFYTDYASAAESTVRSGDFNYSLPESTATKYNYYVYSGAVLSDPDTIVEDLTAAFRRSTDDAYKKGITTVSVPFYVDPDSGINAGNQANNLMAAVSNLNSTVTEYRTAATQYRIGYSSTELVVTLEITVL